VFWVISVYFNIRNTLPKSGTFLLGHPVYGMVREVIDSQRTRNQRCVTSQKREDPMNGLFLDMSVIMVKYSTSVVSKDWKRSEKYF